MVFLSNFVFYPQKLALTSPTSGGPSADIVRSRTKATELLLVDIMSLQNLPEVIQIGEVISVRTSPIFFGWSSLKFGIGCLQLKLSTPHTSYFTRSSNQAVNFLPQKNG
jgi:hypothetical protein